MELNLGITRGLIELEMQVPHTFQGFVAGLSIVNGQADVFLHHNKDDYNNHNNSNHHSNTESVSNSTTNTFEKVSQMSEVCQPYQCPGFNMKQH